MAGRGGSNSRTEAERNRNRSGVRRDMETERRPRPQPQTGPRRGQVGTGGRPDASSSFRQPPQTNPSFRVPEQVSPRVTAPPQAAPSFTPPPQVAPSFTPPPQAVGPMPSPPRPRLQMPVGPSASPPAPNRSATPTAPRSAPHGGGGYLGAGLALGAAAAGPIADYGRRNMEARYGRIEDHPVNVQRRQEEARVLDNERRFMAEDARIPLDPTTPPRTAATNRTPNRAPAPRGEISADRLNELSLALVRGESPLPRNPEEAIAVQRMRQQMGNNEMSRGGVNMPRAPKPKAPKTPKVSAPRAKKPKLPGMPTARMAKGGTARKGKK